MRPGKRRRPEEVTQHVKKSGYVKWSSRLIQLKASNDQTSTVHKVLDLIVVLWTPVTLALVPEWTGCDYRNSCPDHEGNQEKLQCWAHFVYAVRQMSERKKSSPQLFLLCTPFFYSSYWFFFLFFYNVHPHPKKPLSLFLSPSLPCSTFPLNLLISPISSHLPFVPSWNVHLSLYTHLDFSLLQTFSPYFFFLLSVWRFSDLVSEDIPSFVCMCWV